MASGATTIWGRPYPVAGDAPSVHTDIQALANSLETTPLFPTTAVTSRSGVAGESVAVSPSQTLTLPSSPNKGDILQILALGTVTGATPVTVAGGSKVINGVGLAGVSSFLLGTPNTNATVQYDGTAWRVIAGQQDTGWKALTGIAAGFTTSSPRARLTGNIVRLAGSVFNNSGSSFTGTIATLPSASMIPATVASLLGTIANVASPVAAQTSGNIFAIVPNTSNAVLDGITYPID